MEQRESNVELKAMTLVSEFVKKFRSIDFTLHPADIPGEAPGKGSNMNWAARKLSERYSWPPARTSSLPELMVCRPPLDPSRPIR